MSNAAKHIASARGMILRALEVERVREALTKREALKIEMVRVLLLMLRWHLKVGPQQRALNFCKQRIGTKGVAAMSAQLLKWSSQFVCMTVCKYTRSW